MESAPKRSPAVARRAGAPKLRQAHPNSGDGFLQLPASARELQLLQIGAATLLKIAATLDEIRRDTGESMRLLIQEFEFEAGNIVISRTEAAHGTGKH